MRRLFYKTWVRACMVVLCIASFNVSALSLAVMLVGEGIAYSALGWRSLGTRISDMG